MNSLKRFSRLMLLALAASAAALSVLQVAQAGPTEPPDQAGLEVEAGNKLFLVGHATGFQIYSCNPTSDGGFAWKFVAPDADLYDDAGKLIITHFGGPTWQAKDGSKVVGKLVKPAIVDDTAIPWLLLSAASNTAGPDGDRLAGTTFIQRLATTGGLVPPAAECNAGTAGDRANVPYTADYYFWKKLVA